MIIKTTEHVSLRHVEDTGKYYLFCSASGEHFDLNKSAYDIIVEFQTGASVEQVVKLFQDTYEIEEKIALKDVEEIIYFLRENDLCN